MITIKHDGVQGVINLPTSVREITPEMFAQLTSNITLQKHYVLVALCWKLGISEILMTNKKTGNAKVVTVVAKTNLEEKDAWVKVGDIAIVNKSAIELGTHVHVDTVASMPSVYNHYVELSKLGTPNAIGITKDALKDLPKEQVYLLEFKIVPVTDIKASVDAFKSNEDPFKA